MALTVEAPHLERAATLQICCGGTQASVRCIAAVAKNKQNAAVTPLSLTQGNSSRQGVACNAQTLRLDVPWDRLLRSWNQEEKSEEEEKLPQKCSEPQGQEVLLSDSCKANGSSEEGRRTSFRKTTDCAVGGAGSSSDEGGEEGASSRSATTTHVGGQRNNEFTWTALVSQHCKNGQLGEALRAYEEMVEEGVKPSSYTFVALLKACSQLQELEVAKGIHDEAVRSGFQSDMYVGNALVNAYAKCGSLVAARHAFESMPKRDVVSWNAMILGYAQRDMGKEAFDLFTRMQEEEGGVGVVPNQRTYVGALKACSGMLLALDDDGGKINAEGGGKVSVREKCLQQVRSVHAQIVERGLESDAYVGAMLVDVYSKCRSLVDARSVFENMPRRDAVSWTSMILGCAQVDDGGEALQLYARMQQEGVAPNDRTFIAALRACSSLAAAGEAKRNNRCLDQVRAIHSQILGAGYLDDVFVGTMLVDAYAKSGSLVDARAVFDKMPERNVVSWTALIVGYAQMDMGAEALLLYKQMQRAGVPPNDRTYVGALKAYSSLAALTEGNLADGVSLRKEYLKQVRGIHSQIVRQHVGLLQQQQPDVFVSTMLVDAYAKCGSLVDARAVFAKMPHKNVVTWTAMILGYAQVDEGEVALQLYAEMQAEGVAPNDRTFVGALKACGSVAELELGKAVHAQILEAAACCGGAATRDSSHVAGSLIDMYGECGSMVDAQQVFDSLPEKDVVAWSSLIAGYAYQGDSQAVFRLFERMQDEGVEPNGITFLSVLTACSHAGLVDEGQQYFDTMTKDHGIPPSTEHYNCMVDMLGRAGFVHRAMAVAEAMPLKPAASVVVVWKSVLVACRKWSHVELGREAFDRAVSLDASDASLYVLMATIYSTARMYDEAVEVEAMRVQSRAWKQPGQSRWIDRDGMGHVFGVRDWGHLDCREVYAKVGGLLVEMKESEMKESRK